VDILMYQQINIPMYLCRLYQKVGCTGNGFCYTKKWLLLILLGCSMQLNAQIPQVPTTTTEQQMEAITEGNEDTETQDDTFLQQLQQFLKTPINLNYTDAVQLKELGVLNPLQIESLLRYRNLFGNFINIYEIQAVPGWDVATIEKILPYISVKIKVDVVNTFGERMRDGSHQILGRISQVLEKSKGYLVDTARTNNYYPGSPQRFLVRYKYQYKNLLQYGIVADKDAGEQFLKGTQKQGFDFYSLHLFARNIGIIKSLAIGDFTVNMGQGLTQWQSLAFRKGPDVVNIKRQLAVLRPYNAAGEFNFHRGFGITLAKKNVEFTAFVSYKKVDANMVVDTLNYEDYISSIQTSGLHRTKSEMADKGAQRQLAYGGNIAFNKGSLHVGVNAIQYQFQLPINKSAEPYNLYAPAGKKLGNQSIDYSYTYKNFHFFGEAAVDNKLNKAFVNGLIISVDPTVDMSFLYRNIGEKYQSLYSNAFTESTSPTNERGLFSGISIRPNNYWRIDAYVDVYKFPWLRYLVDAPSVGVDYFSQITYKPNKQLEMYARYKWESKAKNFNPDGLIISPVLPKPRQNFRAQINYKIDAVITFRNRIEMSWFDKNGGGAQNGFLAYTDILYKPMMKRYSGNIRLQYFETDGYDSRLYAYENDVLYSFSIPVFYDKGYRYYVNVNYDVNKKMTVWLRWAQTIFKNKATIGSGLDEITGNKRTEVKLQVLYSF
jgi:hypothetical protein